MSELALHFVLMVGRHNQRTKAYQGNWKMRRQYSYFGFDGELSSLRSTIESAIGFSLSERESSYWAGVYFLFKDDTSDLRIQLHRNVNDRGESINLEFPGTLVICSISGPEEKVGLLASKLSVAGGILLASRNRELEDD